MNQKTKQAPLQNIPAEKAILGAVLRSADAYWQVSDRLRADMFSVPLHREIYSAVRDICAEGKRMGLRLVGTRLPEEDEHGQDMSSYLAVLAGDANAEAALDFVDDVIEMAARRRLKAMGEALIKAAGEGKDSADIAASAEAELMELIQVSSPKRPRKISELAAQVVRGAKQANEGGALPGYTTGLIPLDEILGLILGGDLGCILASSGDGKSALAAQVGMHIAKSRPVLMIQMEMSGEQVAARELAAMSGISCGKVQEGAFDFAGWDAIREAETNLQTPQFWVHEDKRITVREIRSLAMAHKRMHGLGALIIDQLDKIKGDGKYKDKFERVEMITNDLKDLAKELNIPIILLDQRTREAQRRDDPVPRKNDSRFPSIDHDCDWIIGLWRHETWLQQNRPSAQRGGEAMDKWEGDVRRASGKAEIICLKRRRGKAFEQRELAWNGALTRFGEFGQQQTAGHGDNGGVF